MVSKDLLVFPVVKIILDASLQSNKIEVFPGITTYCFTTSVLCFGRNKKL